MRLVAGSLTGVDTVALFPGSFHPPTIAHLDLARAAASHAARVVFVLPASFPHKTYGSVSPESRLQLLTALVEGQPQLAVAVSSGGLFLEIPQELRALHPLVRRVLLVCGRDAAERIVGWPYSEGESIESQLSGYELLVASREGAYEPPPARAARIHVLPLHHPAVSASAVRRALALGLPWRHLVPDTVHHMVERFYAPGNSSAAGSPP